MSFSWDSSGAWPDSADDVVAGDHVVALAYATPARGVVVLPVTNFGTRDRTAGTISVNSSVGVPRKLERIRRNPRVSLAFHTRRHSLSAEPQFVLAQGVARLSDAIPDYPSTIIDQWRRFEPWDQTSRLWRRWQSAYALRVEIKVQIERLFLWPDLRCHGEPTVLGPPSTETLRGQRFPRGGTAPRVSAGRAARLARRLPHVLLGWIDDNGFPFVLPVEVGESNADGMRLSTAAAPLPGGGRRAGLTAHSFSRGVAGQHQRKHTGWLEGVSATEAIYAPHTTSAYWLPPSRTVYRLVTGLMTRRGLSTARELGFIGNGPEEGT